MATGRKRFAIVECSLYREPWSREVKLALVMLQLRMVDRWAADQLTHEQATCIHLDGGDLLTITGRDTPAAGVELFREITKLVTMKATPLANGFIRVEWPKFAETQWSHVRTPGKSRGRPRADVGAETWQQSPPPVAPPDPDPDPDPNPDPSESSADSTSGDSSHTVEPDVPPAAPAPGAVAPECAKGKVEPPEPEKPKRARKPAEPTPQWAIDGEDMLRATVARRWPGVALPATRGTWARQIASVRADATAIVALLRWYCDEKRDGPNGRGQMRYVPEIRSGASFYAKHGDLVAAKIRVEQPTEDELRAKRRREAEAEERRERERQRQTDARATTGELPAPLTPEGAAWVARRAEHAATRARLEAGAAKETA